MPVSRATAADAVAPTDAAGIDFEGFRRIMGSFASGISILTTLDAGEPQGMTCSAVCSVSADPPLLLACVKTPSSTLEAIRTTGRFAVNFLDAAAAHLSQLFAGREPDKFAKAPWSPGPTTALPIRRDTVAHAECEVHDVLPAGDHVILLGRILGGQAEEERFPLGYWRGAYVRMFRIPPPGVGGR
jgi:flavin reductase (DIM6/NTAB) family NADH-FMN oxidoreductase RutF